MRPGPLGQPAGEEAYGSDSDGDSSSDSDSPSTPQADEGNDQVHVQETGMQAARVTLKMRNNLFRSRDILLHGPLTGTDAHEMRQK